MRRSERGRTVRAWVGSALVHGTVVLVAWLTAIFQPRPLEYETIQIQMVEAPEEELVIETPDPEPPPPEEEAEPEPEPEPEPDPPPVQEEPPEPDPEPEPEEEEPEPEPVEEEAEPEPTTPESVEASMEGLRKDYPAYYGEIQQQIRRCFRWTRGGDWEATIDFFIDRDGSIPGRDIDIFRSSGNLDFDLRAVEAVECAGQRLGPLPEDLPYERLPIRFNFSPVGSDGTDADDLRGRTDDRT